MRTTYLIRQIETRWGDVIQRNSHGQYYTCPVALQGGEPHKIRWLDHHGRAMFVFVALADERERFGVFVRSVPQLLAVMRPLPRSR